MPRKEPKTATRTVKVMDSSYQPSKAELEADVSINATPEEVGRALMQTVNAQHVKPAPKTLKRGKK